MKRLLQITAILCVAALIPLAAQAQRGGMGGGHMGGGARGVASAHAGGGFAARPAGRVGTMGAIRPTGMRVSSTHSRFVQGRRFFVPRNRFVFNRFDRFRFRHRFFFNNCFNRFGFGGFGCGSPFLSGGFGFPLVDPFFNSGFDEQPEAQQQPVVVENGGGNDRETAFEVQALRDEVQAMREETRVHEEARNAAPARSSSQDEANAVLVFRDGRQLSVRNYAISDHTVWVLSPNSARKIPVAELDVPATEQMNAKNGVEFRLP